MIVVRAVPAQARACRARSTANCTRVRQPRASGADRLDRRPSQRRARPAAQLLADDVARAAHAAPRASTCWKSQPPHRPGRATGTAARPDPARPRAPRPRRPAGSSLGALGDLDAHALARQRVPHEDDLAVQRARRSGRRARRARPRRPAGAVAGSRRSHHRSRKPRRTSPGAGRESLGQLLLGAARRAQLVRDARDHDAGHEQQAALEPQRGLVVQQLLPPATRRRTRGCRP